jgi:hypothetical protein
VMAPPWRALHLPGAEESSFFFYFYLSLVIPATAVPPSLYLGKARQAGLLYVIIFNMM